MRRQGEEAGCGGGGGRGRKKEQKRKGRREPGKRKIKEKTLV